MRIANVRTADNYILLVDIENGSRVSYAVRRIEISLSAIDAI